LKPNTLSECTADTLIRFTWFLNFQKTKAKNLSKGTLLKTQTPIMKILLAIIIKNAGLKTAE
jgi:hypothetical protein